MVKGFILVFFFYMKYIYKCMVIDKRNWKYITLAFTSVTRKCWWPKTSSSKSRPLLSSITDRCWRLRLMDETSFWSFSEESRCLLAFRRNIKINWRPIKSLLLGLFELTSSRQEKYPPTCSRFWCLWNNDPLSRC